MNTRDTQQPRLECQIRGLWSCLTFQALRIYHCPFPQPDLLQTDKPSEDKSVCTRLTSAETDSSSMVPEARGYQYS